MGTIIARRTQLISDENRPYDQETDGWVISDWDLPTISKIFNHNDPFDTVVEKPIAPSGLVMVHCLPEERKRPPIMENRAGKEDKFPNHRNKRNGRDPPFFVSL
ncbi:hypothetical protein [Pasteuria penetrans]|uniref:hypothetical protein n=1 Tax=Pasteuria penetrans TaxID=86005 RepID=UPI0011EC3F7A|nr:hypothetical protein [Pasteuria penetrans]